jgi:eukaryotic-like serine/threonine-protein kinase
MSEVTIFEGALERRSPQERAAYLDGACAGNDALRARVEALLAAAGEPDSLLDHPLLPEPESTVDGPTNLEQPGDRIGRYKLLQKIGEGGFGVVYMAEQKEPVKRRVALKIVKLGMDTEQVVARFESERQALALMDHPNVAKILDAGATAPTDGRYPGRPYFVMELVKGVPITKYCDDNHLTTRQRLELFIPVANAVQHAHQKGIIHRDIKPSNILVTLHDGVPVPKVIDFGIAKATQQELTEKTLFTEYGQIIGTPAYMSPEQAEMSGLDIDTRTDIYSLGVLLYELLVGHTPIDSRELMRGGYDEIRRRIKEEEPRKPSTRVSTLQAQEKTSVAKSRGVAASQLASDLKGDLDWIVLKALEKDRTRRYQTATGLAEDIKRHLGNEPVLAAAPSTSYRVRKYVRRHRAALAVTATIAGLLVAGTIVSSVLAVWEFRARARAESKEHEANEQRILAESNEREAKLQRIRAESKTRETDAALQREGQARATATAAQRDAERRAYAFAMQLAQSDGEGGSLTRLEQTLDATATYPDRGFEWYYWQAHLHQDRRRLYPQLGPLSGVRLAADQRDIIVTASSNRIYRLDAATGSVQAAYGGWVMSTDGRWLADGPLTGNGTTVIDTTTGMRTDVRLPENQWKIALSPDGARLITIDYADRSSLRVWDVATSSQDYEITLDPNASFGNDVKFSPDGQWFADTANLKNGREIELRRASDGERIRSPETIGGQFLGFTPDSRYFARWDATTRQIHLHRTSDLSDDKRVPCEGEPGQIAFSFDGTYVAMATGDRRDVMINELDTGRMVSTYRVHQHSGIAFTHDGEELIASSLDGALHLLPVNPVDYLHIGSLVRRVRFCSDGSRLLLVTDEGARLIDLASRKLLTSYPNVWAAAIFPNGRRIATVAPVVHEHGSTGITIVDDKGQLISVLKYDGRVSALEISPDRRHILVGAPLSVGLLDAETGDRIAQFATKTAEYGAFLPDGTRFALWFEGESQIRIYDTATGSQTYSIPCEPKSQWADFSPDGKSVAMPYDDVAASIYGVAIYDMATKERMSLITGHAGPVYFAHFSPDGRRLFTTSSDSTIRVWDVENGFELLSLHGDAYNVTGEGFAVAPDGRTIAIAGREGVFLKEAATPEQVVAWQRPPVQSSDTEWWKRLGGIQDWLVLAPIQLNEQEDHAPDLDKQQLAGEATLDPRAGELALVGGEEFTWQEALINDCVLDFQKATNSTEDHCLAYAATHIYSDVARQGVRLMFGNDDLAKVYLNGMPIHEVRDGRSAIPADDEVRIDLRKGKNVLVCKVIDAAGDWGLSAQIVGDDYQPIPGVTTGTNP